jgi:hypothetical protein
LGPAKDEPELIRKLLAKGRCLGSGDSDQSFTRAFWVRDEVGPLFSSLAPVMTVLHRLLRLSFYGPTRALSTCSSDGILTELCTWATNNSSAFGISAFMNHGLSDINLEQGIAAWNFNTS